MCRARQALQDGRFGFQKGPFFTKFSSVEVRDDDDDDGDGRPCHGAATASRTGTRRLQKVPGRIWHKFFGQSTQNFLLFQANICPIEKDPLFEENDRGPATIGE